MRKLVKEKPKKTFVIRWLEEREVIQEARTIELAEEIVKGNLSDGCLEGELLEGFDFRVEESRD